MGFIYSQLFVTPPTPTTSFAGQTIIITGSNVGLGKEAARHFAQLNAAKIILAVRNLKAGEDAKADILKTTKRESSVIEVWKLDLSSYETVKAFTKRAESLERVDVLLENAAVAATKHSTAEGHELTITINVISTFLLALLMVPKLKETAQKFNVKPRISIVSSEVHAWTKFEERKSESIFDTLDETAEKNMSERYPTSKLLVVLSIRALAPKLQGTGIILNNLNPGLCHSELGRDGGWQLWLLKLVLARSTEVGSRTLVAGAAAGEESHGTYMTDGHVAQDALSDFVRSPEGDKAKEQVWSELKMILERIEPGVTKGY